MEVSNGASGTLEVGGTVTIAIVDSGAVISMYTACGQVRALNL